MNSKGNSGSKRTQVNKRKNTDDFESVVKNISDYKIGETFETMIFRKFQPYLNRSESELIDILKIEKTLSKSRYYQMTLEIVKAILGVTKNKIEEFEKAAVEMKTIRLEKSGALKKSMPFAQIQIKEIVNEEWLDSYWYQTLTKRFFFVIFQKDDSGELRLKKVMFWTMPAQDIRVAELFWLDTKLKIEQDNHDNFIKISDNRICHVRPKGTNSLDLMQTLSGDWKKKKCYWLNSSYIKAIIS